MRVSAGCGPRHGTRLWTLAVRLGQRLQTECARENVSAWAAGRCDSGRECSGGCWCDAAKECHLSSSIGPCRVTWQPQTQRLKRAAAPIVHPPAHSTAALLASTPTPHAARQSTPRRTLNTCTRPPRAAQTALSARCRCLARVAPALSRIRQPPRTSKRSGATLALLNPRQREMSD